MSNCEAVIKLQKRNLLAETNPSRKEKLGVLPVKLLLPANELLLVRRSVLLSTTEKKNNAN